MNVSNIIQWFELGGSVRLDDTVDSASMVQQLGRIQGLMERTKELEVGVNEPDAVRAAAAEFILEGLYAQRRISRSEQYEFQAGERRREREDDSGRKQSKRQYQ